MSRLMRFFSMAKGVRAASPQVLPLVKPVKALNPTRIAQAIRQTQPNHPSLLGHSRNLIKGLLIGSGLIGLGQALSEQWTASTPQSSIKNLDDLQITQHRMLQTFSDNSSDLKTNVKIINEAVTKQDEKVFAKYLDKLMRNYPTSDDYLDLLISTCVAQGKVSLLKILQEEFELDDLLKKNSAAIALLNHPFANEIERLSGEFIKGVGNIQIDGARLQLRYKQAQDEDVAIKDANIDAPLVTGLDSIDDTRLVLSFLRQQDEARRPVRDVYNSVVVLDVLGEDSESFTHYLKTLKALYEQQQKPVSSIFLIHGAHVTSGEISVNKSTDGQYEVEMFYIDSLGRGSDSTHPGYWLIRDCESVFPKQTTYYLSEVKNQHAEKGCSVFSLMHVYDLIHLKQTLQEYAQAGLPAYEDIFDYIKHNITDIKQDSFYTTDGKEAVTYHYQTVLPPLAFSRGKQTMTRNGVDNDSPNDKRPVVGYMGIPHEITHSSAERQKELGLVVNHSIRMTLEEWFNYYIRPTNSIPRNQTTTLLIGQWGIELAEWLTKQKVKDIEEYTKAFTVHEFTMKNKVSEDIPVEYNTVPGP